MRRPRTHLQREQGRLLSPGWQAITDFLKKQNCNKYKVGTSGPDKTVHVIESSTGMALRLLRFEGSEADGKFVHIGNLPGATPEEMVGIAAAATQVARDAALARL